MRRTMTGFLLALAAGMAVAAETQDVVSAASNLLVCRTAVILNGRLVPPSHGSAAGVWFYADGGGSAQALLTGHEAVPGGWRLTVVLNKGDTLRVALDPGALPLAGLRFCSEAISGKTPTCRAATNAITLCADSGEGAVRLTGFSCGDVPLTFIPDRRPFSREPVVCSPDPQPAMAEALIDWDWRMQDGICTPREGRTYEQAAERLVARLAAAGVDKVAVDGLLASRPVPGAGAAAWEAYWLAAHRLRRSSMLRDPRLTGTPLLFVKHVPSIMSHQLTQMYGYCSRPGGGLFVLEKPGLSMRTRDITPASLPAGNFMTPELSYDAQKLLFAYCPVKEAQKVWGFNDRTKALRYHIHELTLAGGAVRVLTQGDTDNFFPVYLPSGDILFSSSMRGATTGAGPVRVSSTPLPGWGRMGITRAVSRSMKPTNGIPAC